MRKRFFLGIMLVLSSLATKAEGYSITLNWQGIGDTTVFLAHYFDAKIYIDDTTKLDQAGKGAFTGEKKLREGLYVLYLNQKVYIDILIGADQEFNVSTTIASPHTDIRISGADESARFLEYQEFLRKSTNERNQLTKQFQEADSLQKIEINKKYEETDKKVLAHITSEANKYPGSMYSTFLKLTQTVEVPKLDLDRKSPQYDSITWFHYYNYNRDHFFDYVDFSDERILITPLLQPKLDNYFNKVLVQSPDSVIPQALKIINRSKKNQNVYQYVSQFLINNSLQSKIMGMDAVFVAIADKVYLSGEATWADTTILKKVAEEAFLIRQNIIGKVAPELVMENISGEIESLHQLQNDYTILLFWEPNCGHCKKEIPELYEKVYSKYLNYNIEFVAVNISDDKKEWTDFVEEHGLDGWHHWWDVSNQSLFRYKYNVKSTPLLYVLDKEKKIIAKKIDINTLITLLDALLKK